MTKYAVANINNPSDDESYDYTKIIMLIIAIIIVYFVITKIIRWSKNENFIVASDNNYQSVNGVQQVI